MRDETKTSFSTGRRLGIGLNVIVSVAALVVCVVLANYLATRFSKRFELGRDASRALKSPTLRVLQGLTNEVQVVAFFSRKNGLYDSVMDLLREYEAHSPHIKVERVDHERSVRRAQDIFTQYKLKAADVGDCVIFAANGRAKVVRESELAEYEKDAAKAVMEGREIKRTGFRGEQLFTAAIFSVTDPKVMSAYFLRDHGEEDPANERDGYTEFVHLLQENNVRAGMLSLLTADVPEDCQLLIVAGPTSRVAELPKIQRYLERGGRLLLLFNVGELFKPSTERSGLEPWLAGWGIEVLAGQVSDEVNRLPGVPAGVVVTEFGSHPIANPLRRSRIILNAPRVVRPRNTGGTAADAPRVTELLWTSPNAVAVKPDGQAKAEPPGKPLSLAVAWEPRTIQGITPDHSTARMVVIGDSSLFANVLIGAGEANRDFARNVINWLLNREILIEGIGARPLNEYHINLTQGEMNIARWMALAGMPGSVLVFGWMVWWRRRS